MELGLGPNGLWLNPLTKNVLESELAVAAAELHGHQSVGDFARGEGLSVYALIGFLRRPFLVVTPDRPEATDANRPTARV